MKSWYEIKNAAGPKATIRIYEEIGFWGITAEDFARELAAVESTEIEVQISSPGGDVFDGIAIYNALRTHPAAVTTRVDGLAASAASVIVQAGDHRVMMSGSQMMIHNAWGLVVGDADEMRKYADVLDQQNDVLANIYAARSGKDADEFKVLMADETWLTDQSAVEAGLADQVNDSPQAKWQVPQSRFVAKAMATLPEDRVPAVEPLSPKEPFVADDMIPQADHEAVVSERDALRAELDALKAGSTPQDAIDTAALPEPVRAALEEANALRADVERMKAERRAETFQAKASEFKNVGTAAELGPVLEVLDRVAPEQAKTLEQCLKAVNARVAEGALFAELGAGGEPASDDPKVKADQLIAKCMADENISKADATRKIMALHPELQKAIYS